MKKILYDHWKILLASLLAVFGISFFRTIRTAFTDFISWDHSGWIVAGIVIMISIVFLVYKKLSKKPGSSFAIIYGSPRYKKWEMKDHIELYKVNWNFWRGTDSLFSSYYESEDDNLRGWVDGPFCITCDYELDRDYKKSQWVCANGHKKVKIPKDITEDTREKVIKVLEAEYRRQKREGLI